VEVDEDLLRDVLSLVLVHEDPVRDPCHPRVFRCEEGFERFVVRTDRRHSSHPEIYAH
jgi:hypothetical protein